MNAALLHARSGMTLYSYAALRCLICVTQHKLWTCMLVAEHASTPWMALLAGIALAKLGAAVVCTDLPDNLELLKKNCQCNGEQWQLHGCTHEHAPQFSPQPKHT